MTSETYVSNIEFFCNNNKNLGMDCFTTSILDDHRCGKIQINTVTRGIRNVFGNDKNPRYIMLYGLKLITIIVSKKKDKGP